MDTLISKIEKLTEQINNIKANQQPVEGVPAQLELTCTLPHFIWSIEYVNDIVLIKYNYDKEFSFFVKSINCLAWDSYFKGWFAHKDLEDEVYYSIKYRFPEWICIDKRT